MWADEGYATRSVVWLRPGKGHDRTLVEHAFAGVADGATPLAADWPDPGPFAGQALHELGRFAALGALDARTVFASAIEATRRDPGLGEGAATCAEAGFLDDVADSVRTRVLDGQPVPGPDDEAIVLITRT